VKSLRQGEGSIAESYAAVEGDEVWLINSHIPEYSHGNRMNHEPRRPRKLLPQAREIAKLHGAMTRQGLTLVPLSIYFNGRGKAKVELALARGKKAHDKRDTIKERDWKREKQRLLRRKRLILRFCIRAKALASASGFDGSRRAFLDRHLEGRQVSMRSLLRCSCHRTALGLRHAQPIAASPPGPDGPGCARRAGRCPSRRSGDRHLRLRRRGHGPFGRPGERLGPVRQRHLFRTVEIPADRASSACSTGSTSFRASAPAIIEEAAGSGRRQERTRRRSATSTMRSWTKRRSKRAARRRSPKTCSPFQQAKTKADFARALGDSLDGFGPALFPFTSTRMRRRRKTLRSDLSSRPGSACPTAIIICPTTQAGRRSPNI
jgi:SsrA-binding protein